MSSSLKIVFTYLFIVSLSIAFYSSSKLMLGGYLLIGLMTYFTYAKDKRAAIKGEWRVPENTLHLLALCGGWLGALIAQQQFRHKTQKQPFKTLFFICCGLNILGFVWTLTPHGQSMLTLPQEALFSWL
ncbi:membrane protein [Vibrio fortis]|uniref:Membrane protein n=2 Tax=Vibrio fortis TaxID=212667 RepID=A0A066UY08_9VIBR|nr:DUF1294 domain-containing protein [Vibrio fortis]KDN29133.1 membrane protein [Vibrio fortis]